MDVPKKIDAILSAARATVVPFWASNEIEALVRTVGWPPVLEAVLSILQAERDRTDYEIAAEVIWDAVCDGREMPKNRVTALISFRLCPTGEEEHNLAWSITSNLQNVNYLSTYHPLQDAAVQDELRRLGLLGGP